MNINTIALYYDHFNNDPDADLISDFDPPPKKRKLPSPAETPRSARTINWTLYSPGFIKSCFRTTCIQQICQTYIEIMST